MCFRRAKERHSELLAMLDEPDDAIRFEKPYLPKTDLPIWEFVRKFNRVPKEIREDGESNKEENKLAQTLIDGVPHSLHFQFTARCNRRCLLIAIVTPV